MEMQNEQEVENVDAVETEVESQEVETEPSKEPMTLDRLRDMANNVGQEDLPVAESTEDSEEPQLPQYEPNLSYKVKDEEKQFADWLASVVTDKEKEDYLRDIYTKADALEGYKEKYSKVEEEADMYYNQTQQLTAAFKAIQNFRDNQEYDKLQQALGLSDEQLVQMALARVDEQNLPPEQKEAIQMKREYERKQREYEQRMSQFEQQQAEQRIQSEINQLTSLVESEQVRPIAEAMAQRGQNFVEQVLAMGQYEYKRTGVEPSIESVVNKIAQQNSWILEQAKQEVQSLPVVEKKKTLPTVNGTGATRASAPKIRTLEDLKKLANSL